MTKVAPTEGLREGGSGDASPSVVRAAVCHPVVQLAAAGLASGAVYLGLMVRPWSLLDHYKEPLLSLSRLAVDDPLAPWRLLLAFVALGVIYWLGWRAAQRARGRAAWLVVVGSALLAGTILLYLYPFDAADVFDNIMHGRILGVYRANPFGREPVEFDSDPFLPYVAWRNTPSAYGPGWEVLAGGTARLVDRVAGGDGIVANVLAFKLVSGLFLAGSVALTAAILRRHATERALAGTLLLAWNPLLLYETLGQGHNDATLLFWIVASVWCVANRRYTLSVLALVAGALFKFIPLLLVPAGAAIAARSLPGTRSRLRFVAVTAGASALLLIAAYAPFWGGTQVLGIERRRELYTSSLPATVYALLATPLGMKRAFSVVSLAAAGATGLFALVQGLRAWRDPTWLGYVQSAFATLMFYLLFAVLWFQQWYAIWPLGLAVLLPPGPAAWLGVAYTFVVLLKPLVFEPIWSWPGVPPTRAWLELRLGPAVLAVSWLVVLGAVGYGWLRHRRGRAAR